MQNKKPMERILIVDGRQLTWEWVTNYYDTPLSGYARHDGKLYRVERVSEWGNWLNSDYDDDREDGPDNNPYNPSHDDNFEAVAVAGLSWLAYRISRGLFEAFVGCHWTYRNGKRLDTECRPRWAQRIYYKFLKPIL